MDTCQQCNAGLPAAVRFCPFCGKAAKPTLATLQPPDPVQPVPGAAAPGFELPELLERLRASADATARSARAAGTGAAPPSAAAARWQHGVFDTPSPVQPSSGKWKKAAGAGLLLAVIGVGLAAWLGTRGPSTPEDACAGRRIGADLDDARKALGARAFGTALSKSTLALTTCAAGARAEELRRIQAGARNLGLAEGRRCIKNFDQACLDRVTSELAIVGQDPAVKAFIAEVERETAARIDRDLQEARTCIAAGDLVCAERRMKSPTALRPGDPAVQALAENLEQARAALESGAACASRGDPACLPDALEAVRRTSPRSALARDLERRLRTAATAREAPSTASAGASSAPVVVPPPTLPAVATGVTSHRMQVDLRINGIDAQGRQRVSIEVRSEFSVDPGPRATPKVQEAIWIQRTDNRPILGPAIRSPVQSAGRYLGSTTLALPAEATPGTYEAVHQVLLDDVTRSERIERFTVSAAPVEAVDPTAELLRRLTAEGEQCRAEKDCGCMKDKAVAVANIEPRSTWATSMRRLASECARAKLEIR